MDSANVLRNMQRCGETNSHTQIAQAGLRKHLKIMQIIKGPSQNEKLSRMEAVSHATKISFAAEDAGAKKTKQQPPSWVGALGGEGDTASFWRPSFPPGAVPGFERGGYDVHKFSAGLFIQ